MDFEDTTGRLALPYLAAAQAQKHVTLNEGLRMLDTLVQLTVASRGIATPPPAPAAGEAWIVAEAAADAWLGREGTVAAFVDGFWMFHTPRPGWRAFVLDEETLVVAHPAPTDGAPIWKPVGGGLQNVEGLGVGTTSDDVTRLAVAAEASLLGHAGDDHRLKINKATHSDTASIVFQTGYSGRAEFGIAGSDAWSVKTSPDGVIWNEALVADPATGTLDFPAGTHPGLMAPAVDAAGGDDWVIGPMNVLTTGQSRSTVDLAAGRIYFAACYVDRPTVLLGAVAAQNRIGDAGSLLRAGLYRLGDANGNLWRLGERIVDFGTQPADAAGINDYDLPAPVTLAPGWYATALGTDGGGAQVRGQRWSTPGLLQYIPHRAGTASELRLGGPSLFLYADGHAADIAQGLPEGTAIAAMPGALSIAGYQLQMLVPRWKRWPGRG